MGKQQLVVVGGGAAGFFCAVNAARMNPGLNVMILEKTGKLLTKVKVSGGGRCNVTHDCDSIAEMVKKYPRGAGFLKKAFHHFFTTDTINWFRERGVILKTEADGRIFPVSNSSQTIIDCLLAEARQFGVEIRTHTELQQLGVVDDRWALLVNTGENISADDVCISCGGYSKPAQFQWLQKLGHHIEEPVPSLFTFNMPGDPICALMGITVESAAVKIMGSSLVQSGPLLITHWGMSGPAILKLSAWGARELALKNWRFGITVNWVPPANEQTLKQNFQEWRFKMAPQKMVNRNPCGLPQRLWEYLLQQSGINPDMRWADLPGKEQNRLIKNCCAQEFSVEGKTTFKEEFVTAGGIRLEEVDHHTMQSRIAPNLYFAGEVLNVDGVTGGFNFQHAWTSGWIAAKAIADKRTNFAG
jgi:predicted Rossmann fold flavoprotein